jgi:kinesin family protein 2/24
MLLAYGQTGSGKTFTITGLEKLLVEKLMDGKLSGKWDVNMCIFEVAGSNMYGKSNKDQQSTPLAPANSLTRTDLLNGRKQISVMEDPFGAMQIVGVHEKNPTTSSEFLHLIDTAKDLRSTESTTKNDQSSRSHAICRIRVINKETPDSPKGSFLLVDLAGSEASADTQHHSRERMNETREINRSLTILKDCIRTRALWSIERGEANQKHVHIPFRSSKLTQVLKSAFDVNNTQTCKTIVIACINPSILDVAHSKNTLRYAEMLKVQVPKAKPRAFDERVPTTWENDYVQEWIRKNVCYHFPLC